MKRYYCGLTGHGYTRAEGTECPGCESTREHREIPADECGCWVACAVDRGHGHHCVLAPGHAGAHKPPCCGGTS